MTQLRRLILFCAAVCLFVLASERPTLAYADPGTGALLWQLIAASLFGLVFYLRRGLEWIKQLFRKANDENLD
jgi:hypothetical protein